MKFYVYELRDTEGKPFYVGKGSGRRMHDHIYKARHGQQTHRAAKIRQILSTGSTVVAVIVFQTNDEQEAFAEERRLIALYGRDTLTNKTDGGDGLSNPSLEVREKIAQMRRSSQASDITRQRQRDAKIGTHRTEETKRKISRTNTGRKCPWARAQALKNLEVMPSAKGRKHRSESIKKMQAAKMGHIVSEATKKKISQSKQGTPPWNKGITLSEAHKRKISTSKQAKKRL